MPVAITNSIVQFEPSDNANIAVTWSGLGAATISSMTYAPITGLTITGQSISGSTTTVRVSGASHGTMYHLDCAATLSTGETVSRTVALRCFNG
jgi:hypothetical protein